MKLKRWSSCGGGGCGDGDEEELGEALALVRRSEKKIRNEKEKFK